MDVQGRQYSIRDLCHLHGEKAEQADVQKRDALDSVQDETEALYGFTSREILIRAMKAQDRKLIGAFREIAPAQSTVQAYRKLEPVPELQVIIIHLEQQTVDHMRAILDRQEWATDLETPVAMVQDTPLNIQRHVSAVAADQDFLYMLKYDPLSQIIAKMAQLNEGTKSHLWQLLESRWTPQQKQLVQDAVLPLVDNALKRWAKVGKIDTPVRTVYEAHRACLLGVVAGLSVNSSIILPMIERATEKRLPGMRGKIPIKLA